MSSGNRARYIEQEQRRDVLILYNTSPLGKTRMYRFGARILWNLPTFSFLKKVSGIHILLASVMVKYRIFPC